MQREDMQSFVGRPNKDFSRGTPKCVRTTSKVHERHRVGIERTERHRVGIGQTERHRDIISRCRRTLGQAMDTWQIFRLYMHSRWHAVLCQHRLDVEPASQHQLYVGRYRSDFARY